jgi:multiple sugar transport system substrate-binding protein
MKKSLKSGLLAASFLAMPLLNGAAFAGDVTWWAPNWNEPRARALAAKFEAANPGIKVKIEIVTSDGLPQRVLTALRSGAAPDVIDVQHGWVNGYAQNKLIVPLDDLISKDKTDYVPSAIGNVTWDGKTWGIPYRVETHAIIFNKGHFKAAGLDPEKPPQTWDELNAAAKALTREGRSGFAITGGGEVGNTIFRSLPFIWMNGGEIISEDGKKALVNQPAAVAAVKFYTDFFKNKQSPASTLQNDGNANRRLFIAGTVSAYQSGQFDIGAIQKEAPNIDLGVMTIPTPPGKKTAAILGGWSFVVPSTAKNQPEAKKFVAFLAEADNMAELTDTNPARTSAMGLPKFQAPILKSFLAMLPNGRPAPTHKAWVQITQAYFDGIQRILLGDEDVQKSMDGAAKEIQALLDQ